MKKLYSKGKIHPSPSPPQTQAVAHHHKDHLALLCNLPATLLTLTAALLPEDREVLAYLISSASSRFSEQNTEKKKKKRIKEKKKEHPPLFYCSCFQCYMSFWVRWDSSPNRHLIHDILDSFEAGLESKQLGEQISGPKDETIDLEIGNETQGDGVEVEKGSVRRFMSFIGDRIWGVWSQ